jgi:hypothetical protein
MTVDEISRLLDESLLAEYDKVVDTLQKNTSEQNAKAIELKRLLRLELVTRLTQAKWCRNAHLATK